MEKTLNKMFEQQEEFMLLLKQHRNFPNWPIDIKSKAGQQLCREIVFSSVEEYFEALQHLKNWKSHRVTEVKKIQKDKFLEELCDMLHYFIELLIVVGIRPDELYDAYMKKGKINEERIKGNY
jgi:dimeric dUTPase (all-alpha-NTP-PPase superfamily)